MIHCKSNDPAYFGTLSYSIPSYSILLFFILFDSIIFYSNNTIFYSYPATLRIMHTFYDFQLVGFLMSIKTQFSLINYYNKDPDNFQNLCNYVILFDQNFRQTIFAPYSRTKTQLIYRPIKSLTTHFKYITVIKL